MDKTAEKFVDYASELAYSDLTPAAIHAVKRSVVDAMGCALGAFHAEPMKAIRSLAAMVSAGKPATVIGTKIRSSPELAGFANSAMIRYADFSDDFFGAKGDSGPHPSDNIGGVLAAADSAGADGKSLVLGVALAYEACGQMMDQIILQKGGWDYAIVHAIASALGTAKMFGLTHEQMRNALGLAVVPNVALLQTRLGELTNWKGLAGPNGSRAGFFAVQLAQAGITGPAEPFEGGAGFMKQLNNRFDLGIFGGRDTPFKVEGTFFKHYPVVYSGQLLIWSAFELRQKINHEDIESLCLHLVGRYAIAKATHPNYWNPMTHETADHSLPYLTAAALVDGEITARTLTPERFRDPVILALVQKIHFQEDKQYTAAFPGTFNCRMEATLKSGQVVTLHRTNPKGHPANPMSDQEIEAKFLKQVDAVLPSAQSRALLDQLWNLEKVHDIGNLLTLTKVAGSE